jgi:hypothetical protein
MRKRLPENSNRPSDFNWTQIPTSSRLVGLRVPFFQMQQLLRYSFYLQIISTTKNFEIFGKIFEKSVFKIFCELLFWWSNVIKKCDVLIRWSGAGPAGDK